MTGSDGSGVAAVFSTNAGFYSWLGFVGAFQGDGYQLGHSRWCPA